MKNHKIMSVLFYIIAIISIFTMFFGAINEAIWVDEAFSLKLIQHSYHDLIILTAQDVHPPLYYIILKFFVDIGSHFNILDKYIASIVSILPYVVLICISFTTIRKQWGLFSSSIFAFCITLMPSFLSYSTEIRMYSFGMLFVTLAYIEIFEIISYRKLKNWILFLIFGICAAYTHYFACIPVAFLYGYLFFWSIFKERTEFKRWLAISISTFIIYLPWLIVVLNQVAQVKESYWIAPITLGTIRGYVRFVFYSNTRFSGFTFMLLRALYIGVLAAMLLRKDKTTVSKLYTLTGFLVLVLTIIVGILASWIMRPIFVSRYIFPSLGCFWLCFSISLSCFKKQKHICNIVLACLLFIGASNYRSFIINEYIEMKDIEQVKSILKSVDDSTLVVSNYHHIHQSLAYYLNNDVFIWNKEDSNLLNMVYGNIKSLNRVSLESKLSEGIRILYLNVKEYDDMLETLDKDSLQIDYLGDVNFARRYNISVYTLELLEIN